ncbi:cytochrome P450 [Nonomuraea sp. NPDC050663]|uniref:cytochrome P450 n=1 Tax=Nonomuraea sp. NPDC050663 TaxID=3364370 RepID=UPI0037979E1D
MTVSERGALPGPKGRRMVGNTYDYEQDRLGFIARCQKEFGDIFRFSSTSVVATHPALIQEVFFHTNTDYRTEGSLFSDDRTPPEEQMQATEMLMLTRRLGWQGVNKSASTAHAARFLSHLDGVVREVDGRVVNVVPMMKTFFSFAVADYCLGGHGEDVTEIAEALDIAAESSVPLMASSISLPRWLPLPTVMRFKRAEQKAASMLGRQVTSRMKGVTTEVPRDLLDVLNAHRDSGIDAAAIARLLDIVIRASHGVPGTTIAWGIRQLALEPIHLARIRRESEAVRAAAGGEAVETSDLPYTTAFLQELLRLYPPTWLMGRWVHRDTNLAGYDLKRGEQVMFSAYHVHRDPRWWADPEEFRPGRWLGSGRPYAERAYFPFGAGPRICFGYQLAMVQLTLAFAWLAANFDVDVLNAAEAVPTPLELLVPLGLKARFRPRL